MQELLDQIRDHKNFIIVSHINPDGDAVGSLSALALGLHQLGATVYPVLFDGVPHNFQYLTRDLIVSTTFPEQHLIDDSTALITLDLPDASRTGFKDQVERFSAAKKLISIDHHPLGDLSKKAHVFLHDLKVSSTCELLYPLLIELGVRLTPAISTALLTGMYTDTGGFQHSNTTTQTLDLGAELMKRGAKLKTIVEYTVHQKSLENLRLVGVALERLRLTRNQTVAVSVIAQEDIVEHGATEQDLGGIISQLTALKEPHFTLLITESPKGTIRGSLRANDHVGVASVNLTPLAKLLGGGGHAKAAGFSIPGSLEKTADGGWKVV